MARQLWLLRHAEAERLGAGAHGASQDSERTLTEHGQLQARAAGIALARLGADFEAVLFSPKARARETAQLAAEGWTAQQRGRLAMHAPLAGGFDGAQALEAMAGAGAHGQLLLVGHEPDLSRVIGELTGGRADVKKGGLAVLRLEAVGAELLVLMRSRELALIAEMTVRGV